MFPWETDYTGYMNYIDAVEWFFCCSYSSDVGGYIFLAHNFPPFMENRKYA